jgi:cytochrome c-550 PedF
VAEGKYQAPVTRHPRRGGLRISMNELQHDRRAECSELTFIHERENRMGHELKLRVGIALGTVLGLAAFNAGAHGDVTPHPIDTAGLKPLGKDWLPANPYRGNAAAVAIGAEGYKHNCAGCHGLNLESGGMAPDLRTMDRDCLDMAAKDRQEACLRDSDDYFKDIVLKGKKNSEGRYVMPAYGDVFTQEAVWAVKAYVDQGSLGKEVKGPH